jgi:hypothetical protein
MPITNPLPMRRISSHLVTGSPFSRQFLMATRGQTSMTTSWLGNVGKID